MKRELTSHKVNGLNEALRISVLDEPGAGGANHIYAIEFESAGKPESIDIQFQNGPINEAGVNGISQESLLAIVEDRLKSFQAGPYACEENAMALLAVYTAIAWLKYRTKGRIERGVEGTMAK